MKSKRREFTEKIKRQIRERANGLCEMEGCTNAGVHVDHHVPCVFGGGRDLDNGRLLCEDCHKPKSIREKKAAAKVRRLCGETKGRPKRNWPSRPFPKGHRPLRARARKT